MRIGLAVSLDAAINRLGGIGRRAKDMKPALTDVAEVIRQATDQRFRTGGDGDWPKLSPATLRQRTSGSTKPLIDTGRLRASLTSSAAVQQIKSDSVTVGTDVAYAKYVAGKRPPMPPIDGPLLRKIDKTLTDRIVADE